MSAWRLMLGDSLGKPIANYSVIAREKQYSGRFLRPASFKFKIPANHPDVYSDHTDGVPKLYELRRTLRAFRREQTSPGTWQYVCRFAGIVWSVQDVGDESAMWTTVVAYDPFQGLSKRFTGVDLAARTGDGAQIAKALIDAANAVDQTGIATSGYGNVFEATPSRVVQFQRSAIGDAVVQLAGAYNGFDPIFLPVYQSPGTEDGTLVAMSAFAHYGGLRSNALFGYRMPPHNVVGVERTPDVDSQANAITGLGALISGGDSISAFEKDDVSIGYVGRYEDNVSFADVADFAMLDAQTLAELQTRSTPRQKITLKIATSDKSSDGTRRGRVPMPWDDFLLGDSIPVYLDPKFRGGFAGSQRVYGFTVDIGEDGTERLSEVVTDAAG